MAFEDYVKERILEKTPHSYPETKEEIVEYYQEKYPGLGHNGWKQHLIADLLPFTAQTGKNPAKNLARRFDPSRIDNEPRRRSEQEEYKALGQTLEPIDLEIPGGGYEITFEGNILISEECYPRSFTVTIVGDEAEELARTGDPEPLFQAYWPKGDSPAEGVCGEPTIIVTPLA